MSRSVSAPSSVTKTSPCWNGLIVPGSTLMYGSSLRKLILNPRDSSSEPIEALASPLPNEESTPPVTKMYFIRIASRAATVTVLARPRNRPASGPHALRDQRLDDLQVLGRVDRNRVFRHVHQEDRVAMLEDPELLERLGDFERSRLEVPELEQEFPAVEIDPDVLSIPPDDALGAGSGGVVERARL